MNIQRGMLCHQENGPLWSIFFPYYSEQMWLLIPETVKLYWQAHEINLARYLAKCLLSGSCFLSPSQGVIWVPVLPKSGNSFPHSSETNNFLSASLVLWSQTGSCRRPGFVKDHPGQIKRIRKPWFLYLINPHTPNCGRKPWLKLSFSSIFFFQMLFDRSLRDTD